MEIQKIYSEIDTNEKLFSILMSEEEFLLYQKEFGVVSDIVNSGIKRATKKYIGRARTALAKPFYRSAVRNGEEAIKKINEFASNSSSSISKQTIRNTKKNAGRIAGENDARINTLKGANSGTLESRDWDESITKAYRENPYTKRVIDHSKRQRKSFRNVRSGKHKNQILYDGKRPVVELAHEVGHLDNRKRSKFISRIAENPRVRTELNKDVENLQMVGNNEKSGVKNILKQGILSPVINRDEVNATKRGLEIMRNSGATKEELKKSKEHMDNGYKSYKHWQKANLMTTIGNTINIPSRRNESIVSQLLK